LKEVAAEASPQVRRYDTYARMKFIKGKQKAAQAEGAT
jgi:hypothetical protein